MSNAVLKKLPACSSGVLSPEDTPGWAETIQAFIPAPGTTKDWLLRKAARTVFKTGCPGGSFPGFWVEGYFCGETSFYCLKKENENIAPGRQRSRVKILPFSHQLWWTAGAPTPPLSFTPGPRRSWGFPCLRAPCTPHAPFPVNRDL